MSRFLVVLERVTRLRELIDREQRSAAPNGMRLMRMKQLYLQVSRSLRRLTEKRLIAMASAPRFTPRQCRLCCPLVAAQPIGEGRSHVQLAWQQKRGLAAPFPYSRTAADQRLFPRPCLADSACTTAKTKAFIASPVLS